MTTIESPSTTRLDKTKAYACMRPSSKVRILASIAKGSPIGLEQAFITKPQVSLIALPIQVAFGYPKSIYQSSTYYYLSWW